MGSWGSCPREARRASAAARPGGARSTPSVTLRVSDYAQGVVPSQALSAAARSAGARSTPPGTLRVSAYAQGVVRSVSLLAPLLLVALCADPAPQLDVRTASM